MAATRPALCEQPARAAAPGPQNQSRRAPTEEDRAGTCWLPTSRRPLWQHCNQSQGTGPRREQLCFSERRTRGGDPVEKLLLPHKQICHIRHLAVCLVLALACTVRFAASTAHLRFLAHVDATSGYNINRSSGHVPSIRDLPGADSNSTAAESMPCRATKRDQPDLTSMGALKEPLPAPMLLQRYNCGTTYVISTLQQPVLRRRTPAARHPSQMGSPPFHTINFRHRPRDVER